MGNEFHKRHLDDKQFKELIAAIKENGKATDRLSENMGKWLSVMAVAVSTPEDNSEEIKRLTAELKQSTDALESAVNDNNPIT